MICIIKAWALKHRSRMPKRKLIVILLLIFIFFISCITDPILGRSEMRITNIYLTENNMIIEIERWRTKFQFDNPGVGIDDRGDGIIPTAGFHFPAHSPEVKVEEEWRRWRRNISRATITIDLTEIAMVFFEETDKPLAGEYRDRTLYLNREGSLAIGLSGAVLEANIFVEKGNIRILSQDYIRRRLSP